MTFGLCHLLVLGCWNFQAEGGERHLYGSGKFMDETKEVSCLCHFMYMEHAYTPAPLGSSLSRN
jgi:hypothetical protein